MKHRKLAAGVAVLAVAVIGTSVALAAVPSKTTINESQTLKFKPNRYVQDGLRWKNDTYTVKSGGTLHVVFNVTNEGPHTFTVVKEKDLPRTVKAFNNCRICQKLGQAHGADPNSDAPPKFAYLENGVGENDGPPNVDRPGDSALIGIHNKKGEAVNLKVTAKKGTTLYFMCIIHNQMQAKVLVK